MRHESTLQHLQWLEEAFYPFALKMNDGSIIVGSKAFLRDEFVVYRNKGLDYKVKLKDVEEVFS